MQSNQTRTMHRLMSDRSENYVPKDLALTALLIEKTNSTSLVWRKNTGKKRDHKTDTRLVQNDTSDGENTLMMVHDLFLEEEKMPAKVRNNSSKNRCCKNCRYEQELISIAKNYYWSCARRSNTTDRKPWTRARTQSEDCELLYFHLRKNDTAIRETKERADCT